VEPGSTDTPITLYWRPGCPFCSSLMSKLDRQGVPTKQVNIWEVPEAAEIVKGIANGNETVPTVVVGEVSMVNPSAKQVVAELRKIAPELAPEAKSWRRRGSH